jgi:hypothetical protein
VRNGNAGDDVLHQLVQVEMLLVLLCGLILYNRRNEPYDRNTDVLLSGASVRCAAN